MHTSIGIDMAAPPRTIFDMARDVTRWPTQLPHYREVTIRSRENDSVTATMRAVRPIGPFGLPVSWRSKQWADDSDASDLQLRFLHTGGATRGMDVTWHIRPTARGSRVTIEHVFKRPLPLVGDELFPWVVDRFFVRPIAGRTLKTFKRLAEAAT
jgi:ribosome-associated toxin RatA of RatAB toxin-antitoxin module